MSELANDSLGVLQIVDALCIGGTERVSVSLANRLADNGYRSFLCSTREDGPLVKSLSPSVEHLSLGRTRRLDWHALHRLVRFIRENQIGILHAHSSSILTANLASRFSPYPRIVWHDHFGPNEQQERPVWLYRSLVRRAGAIVTVSEPLARWSRDRLRYPAARISCLPNFVDMPQGQETQSKETSPDLPGTNGSRIVCVANLRPEKGHPTLIRAMKQVVAQHPEAHLLLVGRLMNDGLVKQVRQEISTLQLDSHVSLLGPRDDIPDILRACDIGVLASEAEGLPVSLLEYGAAGLPVVVTDVGQCAEVLDEGRTGIIVSPSCHDEHASAINALLDSPSRRTNLGNSFRDRVLKQYSADATIKQLSAVYEMVCSAQRDGQERPATRPQRPAKSRLTES